MVARREYSDTEIQARIARFDEMKPLDQTFLDSRLAGNAKDVYSVVGANVQQDPTVKPAISPEGFNVAYAGCEPGNGAGLHDHETVETFIPLSSKWRITWGEAGEHETILDRWDCFAVPAGLMRAFENVGDSYGVLLSITDGTHAGKITWADTVKAAAEKTGLIEGADGNLIDMRAVEPVD